MCDTMVALGSTTRDGSVIFAKNSDRQPNEPHIMIKIPGKKHDLTKEKYVQTTYIQIPQVKETYEVMLLKPSWIWGCEMGCNEYGLNIGNEAVFTKEKNGKSSLIGMDMVRLALERCKTSEEAVDLMIELLDKYGQGGNCGYEKPFTYHNSFLIADKHAAWVLETAGQYWAAKKVKGIYCISNCLTIENDYDRCHPNLVQHAIDKKWCRNESDFNFARCYSNHLVTHFSGAKRRRYICETTLQQEKGNITVETMKRILRAHAGDVEHKQFTKSSLKSVCMHAGGMIGDHTTGSYVASLNDQLCTYWVTGSSTPCISIFKPVWFVENNPLYTEQNQVDAVEYWKKRELIHRQILACVINIDKYIEERNHVELLIEHMFQELNLNEATDEKLAESSRTAFEMEQAFIDKWFQICKEHMESERFKGSLYYNYYWKQQNKKLFRDK